MPSCRGTDWLHGQTTISEKIVEDIDGFINYCTSTTNIRPYLMDCDLYNLVFYRRIRNHKRTQMDWTLYNPLFSQENNIELFFLSFKRTCCMRESENRQPLCLCNHRELKAPSNGNISIPVTAQHEYVKSFKLGEDLAPVALAVYIQNRYGGAKFARKKVLLYELREKGVLLKRIQQTLIKAIDLVGQAEFADSQQLLYKLWCRYLFLLEIDDRNYKKTEREINRETISIRQTFPINFLGYEPIATQLTVHIDETKIALINHSKNSGLQICMQLLICVGLFHDKLNIFSGNTQVLHPNSYENKLNRHFTNDAGKKARPLFDKIVQQGSYKDHLELIKAITGLKDKIDNGV